MEQYLETITLSTVLVVLAFILIGVGWIFTGKQKIKGGTCGRDPTKQQDESCETKKSCPLCEKPEAEKDEPCQK